jgi:hypothetical protein
MFVPYVFHSGATRIVSVREGSGTRRYENKKQKKTKKKKTKKSRWTVNLLQPNKAGPLSLDGGTKNYSTKKIQKKKNFRFKS